MTCKGCSRIHDCYGDEIPWYIDITKACFGYDWDENDDGYYSKDDDYGLDVDDD